MSIWQKLFQKISYCFTALRRGDIQKIKNCVPVRNKRTLFINFVQIKLLYPVICYIFLSETHILYIFPFFWLKLLFGSKSPLSRNEFSIEGKKNCQWKIVCTEFFFFWQKKTRRKEMKSLSLKMNDCREYFLVYRSAHFTKQYKRS